jgi:pimeloyl-ACP methyl ester carboxylesterase
MSTNPQDGTQPTVVLVHGGFVDGSGWQGVYNLLKDSYNVRVVQNPTLSLEGDVAATKMLIGAQSEPVILVGHSYGGAVITEAGNDPKVAALVYIAAFVPDQGESVQTILGKAPPSVTMMPPILPPQGGFLFLDREKMPASFAGDLSADEGAFMTDSQVPWGVEALSGTVSEAAWRSKPSWYLVATEDGMIPPPAQRSMSEGAGSTVEEAAGSHAIYVSQPAAVAELIEKAASEVSSAAR